MSWSRLDDPGMQESMRRALTMNTEPTPVPFDCRSSADWELEYSDAISIMDPDGWDRSSPEAFEKSWMEKITRTEFERRMGLSTCAFKQDSLS